MKKARVIAYYLPQFHPIPENDEFWGPGFTEWTNVAKAKPLFKGHYQPRIPADLGFYDLRLPEVREQQAAMAREAGIEGFCYWHYWFGNGKMLLQRPFEEVLKSGKPDFPFCLAWANHNWSTKTWSKNGSTKGTAMIAEQLYPGDEDYTNHFNYCLPAFLDKRYITIDGEPVFCIFDVYEFADVKHFIELWQDLARKAGLKGIHFVGITHTTSSVRRDAEGNIHRALPNVESSADLYNDILDLGFSAVNSWGKSRAELTYEGKYRHLLKVLLREKLRINPSPAYDYGKVITKEGYFAPEDKWTNVYPTIMPGWDRSPRVGTTEGIYSNATPAAFQRHVQDALDVIADKDYEHRVLFLRAWNEWGEGNYVEPDLRYGRGFVEALKNALQDGSE